MRACGIVFAALALAPASAFSQGLVQGGAAVTRGHAAQWITSGVLGDAGGAGGSQLQGSGYLTELGITNTGTPFAINDALISSQGGYHSLSLGANALGGGLINYQANAGAQPLPFQICVNASCQSFPILPGSGQEDCPSIVQFGGSGNGTIDNGPPLAGAIAAQGSAACVSFPPGKYKFAAPFNFTYPSNALASLTLRGAGGKASQLIGPAGGNLLSFTLTQPMQSIDVSDMALVAISPCGTCTALSLTMQPGVNGTGGGSNISRLNIIGSDASGNFPSGNNYWETGIDDFGVADVNFTDNFIQGAQNSSGPTPGTSRGIYLHGDATHIPVAFNFSGNNIYFYNRGVDMGDYVQGIQWVNGNLVGNMVGFYVSSAPGHGANQLSIANASLNACSNVYVPSTLASIGNPVLNSVQITNSVLITIGEPWPCPAPFTTSLAFGYATTLPTISNNLFDGVAPFSGINISGPNYQAGSIVGNVFGGSWNIAVDTTSPNPSVVGFPDNSGGIISNNRIGGANVGIQIGPRSFDYVVSNNLMISNTTDLVDNSGSTNQNMVDIPRSCQPALSIGFGQNGITNTTWSGGQVTYTTAGPHGVNPGDTFQIFNALPNAYDGTFTALAGTSGTTLVASIPTNPGAATQQGILFGSTNVAYSSAQCTVSIVGRQVSIDFDYKFSNLGTSVGTPMLMILPNSFSPMAPNPVATISYISGVTGLTGPVSTGIVPPFATEWTLTQWSPTGNTLLTKANLTNSTELIGRIQFRAPSFQTPPT